MKRFLLKDFLKKKCSVGEVIIFVEVCLLHYQPKAGYVETQRA